MTNKHRSEVYIRTFDIGPRKIDIYNGHLNALKKMLIDRGWSVVERGSNVNETQAVHICYSLEVFYHREGSLLLIKGKETRRTETPHLDRGSLEVKVISHSGETWKKLLTTAESEFRERSVSTLASYSPTRTVTQCLELY